MSASKSASGYPDGIDAVGMQRPLQINSPLSRSRRVAEESSGFKVLIEDGTDHILGAHLLGPHADETINLFALAIKSGIPASDLQETIFGYPTLASDVRYML